MWHNINRFFFPIFLEPSKYDTISIETHQMDMNADSSTNLMESQMVLDMQTTHSRTQIQNQHKK